jgi:ribonuclease HI
LITIYTDGASRGNPGPGGWGAVLMAGSHYKELAQGYKYTTNNRMELLGVINALKAVKKFGSSITLYSDSKYVVDAINKQWLTGWQKKNFLKVKNPDLWIQMVPLLKIHQVKFVWVKGHAANKYNNRCDELATAAADGDQLIDDTGYTDDTDNTKLL